jgi:hypothetical protein
LAGAELVRDIGVSEAIAYVCFRKWGSKFYDAAGSNEVSGAKEYDEFLQAVADDQIPIWGKKENYHVYEPVPHEYWFDNRIEWFDLLKDKPSTEVAIGSVRGERYLSLMTSRKAVEHFWPAIGSTGPRALSSLKISFSLSQVLGTEGNRNLPHHERTVGIKLENRGQRTLTECRITINAVELNTTGIVFPCTLIDGITLAPGADILVPLVRYGEPFDGKAGDSFTTLATIDNKPFIDLGENVLMKLSATGIDTPTSHAQCRIWVEDGKLQIQNVWT